MPLRRIAPSLRWSPEFCSAVLMLPLVVALLAACGAAEPGDPTTSAPEQQTTPRADQPRIDGSFELVNFTIDGVDQPFAVPAALTLDARFGDLNLSLGCHRHYGAATLSNDSTASFTIAGGTAESCPAGEADRTVDDGAAIVLDFLGTANRWEPASDGLVFSGPNGSLRVRGPIS